MFSECFEHHFDEEANKRESDKDTLGYMKNRVSEHPNNDSKENFIIDGKSVIKEIWESITGEGYESKNSFSTRGKNGEDINVEYKNGVLYTSIQVNNEKLEIILSGYEKQKGENNQKEKHESPINVSYSGNISARNLQKLFGNNINSISDLTNQQGINFVKRTLCHEVQSVHGFEYSKKKAHKNTEDTKIQEKNKQFDKYTQEQKKNGEQEKIEQERQKMEQNTRQELAELEEDIIESNLASIGTEDGIEQPNIA